MVPPVEAYALSRKNDRTPEAIVQAPYDPSIFHPGEDLAELFHKVAGDRDPSVFLDGKQIVDSDPRRALGHIGYRFAAESTRPDFNPTAFWQEHFEVPETALVEVNVGQCDVGVDHYITNMWSALTYHAPKDRGSMIGTPYPHLKPGERFSEGYYWDLADAVSGLLTEASNDTDIERYKKEQLVLGVAGNIVHQIERFGYVPNGLRRYYLGRSQPPVFAGIVKEMASYFGERKPSLVEDYLPAITKEYEWWMRGENELDRAKGQISLARVVELPDGAVLNRHWDDNNTPRPESHSEDIATALLAPKGVDPQTLFRHLRAGAESGRDFTARVMTDPEQLSTIHATDFLPPELNSLLWEYEDMIAQAHDRAGRSVLAEEFHIRADRRQAAINTYLWNESDGCYYDHDFVKDEQSRIKAMGMAYPVARGVASVEQGLRVARVLKKDLLKIGGFLSTDIESPQQWDRNNGFARDQVEGVNALLAANDVKTAVKASHRWLSRDRAIFAEHGVLFEKNNVVSHKAQPGCGGEYPVQRGFLWTNGAHRVLQKFLNDVSPLVNL